MGHLHLNVADQSQARKLWVDQLGGTPVKLGPGEAVRFPGVFVMLRQSKRVEGVQDSCPVAYVAFRARDLRALTARLKAGGANITLGEKRRIRLLTREALPVEFYADPALSQPIRFARIHYRVPDPAALRDWYRRTFKVAGTAKGRALDLPGVRLTFEASGKPVSRSAGAALDHVSFEVRGLENFCRALERADVTFERPFRRLERVNAASAVIVDPSGMVISLTEGLARY